MILSRSWGRTGLFSEIIRFIGTGALNTLLTLLLYQLLVTYFSPELSYAVAWIAGFLFLVIAYPAYVFRSGRASTGQGMLLLILYLCSFALGLLLMWLSAQWGIHERLSVIIVIGITATINYIFARLLFGNHHSGDQP